MAMMNEGVAYEEKIKTAVRRSCVNLPGVSVSTKPAAAFHNSEPDITILLGTKKKQRVQVEIKYDGRSQMGNPAKILYDRDEREFTFVDSNSSSDDGGSEYDMDSLSSLLIVEAVKDRQRDLDRMIDFLRQQAPVEHHSKLVGTPVKGVSKDAWDAMVAKGLLRPLNTKVTANASIIHKHYAKKGTYYMQIGQGGGFFYLADNPLDLPIPQLRGDINIELRLKSEGPKMVKSLGFSTVRAPLVALPRISSYETSPYTLEERDHIIALFGGRP